MSETDKEPGKQAKRDAEQDLAEHERPEKGLIGDEDLPEDLQPTDDNPLAKNPGDSDEDEKDTGAGGARVEGMPDMGDPGAPG